jgi:tRNA-dihydrouridine synthase
MKNPKLAREIIRAAKEGGGNLPISVKTRIGYNQNEIETWIRELLSEGLAALIIHLRTRREMSEAPAHWDLMKRIVGIRDEMKKETLILGNGDVLDLENAREKVKESGCDGVMLGRAIFGNPWLFSNLRSGYVSKSTDIFLLKNSSCSRQSRSQVFFKHIPSLQEKLKVVVEHTKLFEKTLSRYKNFAVMKKHYKAYVNGFNGAKKLRTKLMEAKNASQVEKIIENFLK